MSNIKVLPVFPGLLGQAWPFVGPLLLRGQIECTPDMQASLNELLQYVLKAHKGECIIWSIIDEKKQKVVAAMITEMVIDDGKRVLWVGVMSGENILSWGKIASEVIAEHAKDHGAEAFRFWSRKAAQRAYNKVNIIKSADNGMHLFERKVA